jgi:hypothetical protein
MSVRERAERVDQVAEELSVYFLLLSTHQSSFAKGDDKQLYTLVEECFKLLWEKGVENTYATGWKDVAVWKRVEERKSGEAERLIREQVRWRLQKARNLAYERWWVADGVDRIGEYVDRWFGGDGAQPVAAPSRSTPTAAEKMRDMLAELLALYGKYAKEAN